MVERFHISFFYSYANWIDIDDVYLPHVYSLDIMGLDNFFILKIIFSVKPIELDFIKKII